jgi:NDP-sugar pyrophosphorylase family protein
MILCAGLGTRMEPLTRHWAKPALPILDEPLILGLIRTLADQGVDAAVVNARAHPESLIDALGSAPIPVEVSMETELLGSGGGIRRARSFLESSEPFLVLNGDMRLDLDLTGLLDAHARGGGIATLALKDDPRKRSFGSIGYDGANRVRRIAQLLDLGGEVATGLFVGVHVMDPRIFQHMPDREAFETLPDVYLPALQKGERLQCWLQSPECEWSPVGSPRELLDANLGALRAMADPSQGEAISVFVAESARVDGRIEAPAWIGADAEVAANAQVGPWAVISAGSRVLTGTRVERALLLPGAHPPAGASLSRAIGFAAEVWRDA